MRHLIKKYAAIILNLICLGYTLDFWYSFFVLGQDEIGLLIQIVIMILISVIPIYNLILLLLEINSFKITSILVNTMLLVTFLFTFIVLFIPSASPRKYDEIYSLISFIIMPIITIVSLINYKSRKGDIN